MSLKNSRLKWKLVPKDIILCCDRQWKCRDNLAPLDYRSIKWSSLYHSQAFFIKSQYNHKRRGGLNHRLIVPVKAVKDHSFYWFYSCILVTKYNRTLKVVHMWARSNTPWYKQGVLDVLSDSRPTKDCLHLFGLHYVNPGILWCHMTVTWYNWVLNKFGQSKVE